MSRTVVDIDRSALEVAARELGTSTVKDTVNQALRRVAADHRRKQLAALDEYPDEPIDDLLAWRRERDDHSA